MPDFVSYRLEGKVAVVGMDDGKVNALGPQMIAELNAALTRADNEARAVVLHGRAGRFCAGFDLRVLTAAPPEAKALFTAGAELYVRLFSFPRPTVIAATGHALAGGALLLLCGDTRIGAEGPFQIGLNEVAIGMPVPHLATELARDRLDPRRWSDAVLHAGIFSPDQAVGVGYLDTTAPAEAVVDEAIARATTLAAFAPAPYAHSKANLRSATVARIREGFAEIEQLFPE